MPAELITKFKDVTPEGALIELVVWRLPQAVPPCHHPFKYRLVLIVDGQRVIGFDNERGKGDHWHGKGGEQPYTFVDVEQLIEDFIGEVERWRREH